MQQILYSYNVNKKSLRIIFIFILLMIFMMFATPIFVHAENDEIEVDTPSALQEALNSDVAVIKIIPQNDEDHITLDKPLTISKDRTVTLVADKAIKLIGASNPWQFITSSNVSIKFINVTLDGNNAVGSIYNTGTLRLENAVIQNCYSLHGAIYSVGNLTVINSTFTKNLAPTNLYDGGGIYARGLTSRSTVTISNSTFKDNTARYGGAVRIDNADIRMKDCKFSGNTAVQGSCIYIADAADLKAANCTLEKSTGSGAIFVNNSAITMTDGTIKDNIGRGIYGYAYGGDADITIEGNAVVSGNAAKTSYGGGIIGYSWGDNKTTININENAVVSGNEAVHGGGVSGYPGSNVIINMSGNAQISNNTAYENGGGIYGDGAVNISGGKISSNVAANGGGIFGAQGTNINIRDALISDNTAEQDGGGIWADSLSQLTMNNATFQNNSASTGYFWRVNAPADENQSADAITHNERILKTSYTAPYTNAYSNYDINYTTVTVLTPYTVSYEGNGNDNGTIPTDQNNPYLAGEVVTVLSPPDSLTKSGYYFAGWNTKPDRTGNDYKYDKVTIQFNPSAFAMGSANVALYAQWDKIELIPPEPEIPEEIETPPEDTDNLDVSPESSPDYEIEPLPEDTVYWDVPPEYPPEYELEQTDDNTIEVRAPDKKPIGRWVSDEKGWSYYANQNSPGIVPQEDGSFEAIAQDGTPEGLWSKNEDDVWVYEEYVPLKGLNFAICGLALLGLFAVIYYLIIARRHVTRGRFVRMIVRAIHLELEIEDVAPYTDVTEDAKYYHAIMNARAAGLLPGFQGSEFQPEIAITREEMASILAETVRFTEEPMILEHIDLSAAYKDFDDTNELFLADIQLVVQLEIMRERSDARFDPKGLSYRKHVKKIIENLLAVIAPYLPQKSKE